VQALPAANNEMQFRVNKKINAALLNQCAIYAPPPCRRPGPRARPQKAAKAPTMRYTESPADPSTGTRLMIVSYTEGGILPLECLKYIILNTGENFIFNELYWLIHSCLLGKRIGGGIYLRRLVGKPIN